MKWINYKVVLFLVLISCQEKDPHHNEYYQSGNLKSLKILTDEGSIDSIKVYYDTIPRILKELRLGTGKIFKYYKNGNLFLSGRFNKNNIRIGEWRFYTENGGLSEIREYYEIDGQSYLNQNIYFDELGNKLYTKDDEYNYYSVADFKLENLKFKNSTYAEFDFGKDTISINESWKAVCIYYTPKFRSSKSIIVIGKDNALFNKEFSNIELISKDTFYSLSKDVENKKWFPEDNPDHTIVFGKWFDSPGEKIIRGFMSEYLIDNKQNKKLEKRIYFTKTIYVEGSVSD